MFDELSVDDRMVEIHCLVCSELFRVPRDRTTMHRGIAYRRHLNKHVRAGQLKEAERAKEVTRLGI